MKQWQVVGRKAATETDPNPPAYRMKLFAPNRVMAESRFWYFIHTMRKMKRTTGEILDVNELREVDPFTVKNYGIWIRYDSTTGTHNMYKEYRDLTLCGAVDQLYEELAGRHRVRPRSMQIMRTAIIDDDAVKRPSLQQYLGDNVKFPLPHRIPRAPVKKLRPKFLANRPCTFRK
eukprot:g1960.t1